MRSACIQSFWNGRQLFTAGNEYEVPKGAERFFAKPVQVDQPELIPAADSHTDAVPTQPPKVKAKRGPKKKQ